jgi:hypothetical protein
VNPSQLDPRRLVILLVTPEILVELLRGATTHQATANPIPDDAEIVSAYFDPDKGAFAVLLWSATFPIANIPYREAPPLLTAKPSTSPTLFNKITGTVSNTE